MPVYTKTVVQRLKDGLKIVTYSLDGATKRTKVEHLKGESREELHEKLLATRPQAKDLLDG